MKDKVKTKDKNNKRAERKYKYYHGDDCYVFATFCGNCKQEVGGWSAGQADEAWDKHVC